jgi:hypothetical protein
MSLEVAEQTQSTFHCLTHWLDRRRKTHFDFNVDDYHTFDRLLKIFDAAPEPIAITYRD